MWRMLGITKNRKHFELATSDSVVFTDSLFLAILTKLPCLLPRVLSQSISSPLNTVLCWILLLADLSQPPGPVSLLLLFLLSVCCLYG